MNISKEKPIVRIHSECFTGDVLSSKHCDCGPQLNESMRMIAENGNGVIIFPSNHEGRGIGFTNKIRAYHLMQHEEVDTYEANKKLGFEEDLRNYDECKTILEYLQIDNFKLLSSNPSKINSLQNMNFEYENLICGLCETNSEYLIAKAKKHGIFALPIKHSQIHLNKKIAVIHASWYENLIIPFVKDIQHSLTIPDEYIHVVPGCFELPLVAKRLSSEYDCIIAIGVVLKGDTYHFECISDAVTQGFMNVQLETNVPIIDGVLSCYTIEQVEERLKNPQGIIDTTKFLCGMSR